MEPILPGLWVEDVEESEIRIREQVSIDETDRWIVFGYQGKKCVSVQGWKIKKNAEDWAQRLRRMKLRVRTLPKSKVKVENETKLDAPKLVEEATGVVQFCESGQHPNYTIFTEQSEAKK